ncbi:hypothetical protein IAQ61_003106 [Plenodomus lingam]|nr:hypothetical protein IAQ61_003106 [Plenodomus lingam]
MSNPLKPPVFTKPIPIIGAGIAGLTIARCLLQSGIRTTLYEKASGAPRHNYGITLYASSYRPLLSYLGVPELDFKSCVAVDADAGGTGRTSHVTSDEESPVHTIEYFRANRARLERWLGEGLDIRYSSAITNVEATDQTGPIFHLANGEVLQPDFVIAADGVHSSIRRAFVPTTQLEVLPLVAFNGKRRVDAQTFEDVFAAAFQRDTVLHARHGDSLLTLSLNDKRKDDISLSWTFSRPPRSTTTTDSLHHPTRSTTDAHTIPPELFSELATLKPHLPSPFPHLLNPEHLRNDRILHWLMRRSLIPLPSLHTLLHRTNILLLGDAAHTEPIIGGNGANAAVLDGVVFAREIAERGVGDGAAAAYEIRYGQWESAYARWEGGLGRKYGVGVREGVNL